MIWISSSFRPLASGQSEAFETGHLEATNAEVEPTRMWTDENGKLDTRSDSVAFRLYFITFEHHYKLIWCVRTCLKMLIFGYKHSLKP